MVKPVQLVKVDSKGKFSIGEEAAGVLAKAKYPVSVIGVAGLYRTGKSYLLNRFVDRQDGFDIGATVNACTKGIWIWGETIDKTVSTGKKSSIVLMDTEGLGSVDQSQQHDLQIFALTILLSSYFVYNSIGKIDEQALDQLALVANLTKHIQVKSDKAAPEELSPYFPSFMWVLRDFNLKLVDTDGKKITSREYLENSIRPVKKDSRSVAKNKIRKAILSCFKDRDCVTMVRPVSDEDQLQNLEKLNYKQVRAEFKDSMDHLKKTVFEKLPLKTINGGLVTGQMLVGLARNYVGAMNRGTVPVISNAWDSVCAIECQKGTEESLNIFRQVVHERTDKRLPIEESELEEVVEEANAACWEHFRAKSMGSSLTDTSRKKLEANIKVDIKRVRESNANASREFCTSLLTSLFNDFVASSKEIAAFGDVDAEISAIIDSYTQQGRGPAKMEVLKAGQNNLYREAYRRVFDPMEQTYRKELKEAQTKVNSEHEKMVKVMEERESTMEDLRARLQDQEKEVIRLENVKQRLKSTEKELQSEKSERESTSKRLTGQLEALKAEVSDLKTQLRVAQMENKSLSTTNKQLTAENRRLEDMKDNLSSTKFGTEKQLTNLKLELSSVKSEFEAAKKDNSLTMKELKAETKRADKAVESEAGMSIKMKELEEKLKKTEEELERAHAAPIKTVPAKTAAAKRKRAAVDALEVEVLDVEVARQAPRNQKKARVVREPTPEQSDFEIADTDESLQEEYPTLAEVKAKTVQQIKSLLTSFNVELPVVAVKKQGYVDLYRDYLESKGIAA